LITRVVVRFVVMATAAAGTLPY